MNKNKGFTLVELLCVCSIMVVLSALVIPAMQTPSGTLLFTSAARLSTMLESARQTAILKRQPVAVAMLPADSSSVQRFTALQYSGSNSWIQIARWTALPTGVLADSPADTDSSGNMLNAFAPTNSPVVSSTLPGLVYAGTTYKPGATATSYGYVIFLPDGSLYQNNGLPKIPCITRVVEGTTNGAGGIKFYTGARNTAGGPANYCDIVLNNTTGQVKLVRP